MREMEIENLIAHSREIPEIKGDVGKDTRNIALKRLKQSRKGLWIRPFRDIFRDGKQKAP